MLPVVRARAVPVGGPASGMPARLTLLQIASYGRRADRLRSLPRAPIKAATRGTVALTRGNLVGQLATLLESRWLAGMRQVARGVGTDLTGNRRAPTGWRP